MGIFDSIFGGEKKPYSTVDELCRRAKDAKKIIPIGAGVDVNMGDYIMDISHLTLGNETVITISRKGDNKNFVVSNNSVLLTKGGRVIDENFKLDDYTARGFTEVIGSAIRIVKRNGGF